MKQFIFILMVSFLAVTLTACADLNAIPESSVEHLTELSNNNAVSEQDDSPEQKTEFANEKIRQLVDNDEYSKVSQEERKELVYTLLKELEQNGNIQNLYYDESNHLFSFQFADGVLGGVAVKSFSNDTDDLPMN